MALATLVTILETNKVSIFGAPPEMALVMDMPPSEPQRNAPYKQQAH